MVAAPESLAQAAASEQQARAPGKAIKEQSVEAQAATQGSADSGVNGFAVVDTPANGDQANLTPEQQASARSHTSNFDPTPQAPSAIPPPEVARNIPCRFFPLGTCKYGEQCAFSHNIPGFAAPPAPVAAPAESQEQQQQAGAPQLEFTPQQHDPNMMYYPPPMEYGGFEPQFSPQQGYYPFPPFQHYPGHFPPQPYYQPGPPPPALLEQQAAPLPTASPSAGPDQQLPPVSPSQSFASPPAPQSLPLLPNGQPQPYSAYLPQSFAPQQAGEFAPVYPSQPQQPLSVAPTSPTLLGPDGTPLPQQPRPASLHTFFQTSAPSALPPSFPKNGPVPRGPANAAARRPGFVPPPNALGFKPRPSFPKNGPKPACSYFEANRCRHGDSCNFAHILPDGSDARALGVGMIGVDGRTDNPEKSGGLPQMWIDNPKFNKGLHGIPPIHHQRTSMNGGYSGRDPKPRFRYEEEQRIKMEQQAQQAGIAGPAAGVVAPVVPGQPRMDAPTLVTAINRLTRSRAPPAANQAAAAPVSAAPASNNQRLPSNDDFPALSSAPLSPSLEKPASRPESPNQVDSASSSTTLVEPVPAPAVEEKKEVAEAKAAAVDEDFVIVNHSDAAAPAPAVVTPAPAAAAAAAPAPAPVPVAPKAPMSFASAAARGASIVSPVVEKKKPFFTPVSVKVEETKEVKEGAAAKEGEKKTQKKKGKGNGGERREPRAERTQNVPVKA